MRTAKDYYLLTYYPSRHLAFRAATKDLQLCLFWAILVSVPHEWFQDFISDSTVRRQVTLGLPLLRRPSGVQWRAVFTIESGSLLKTCPIHFHLLLVIMVVMSSCLHFRRRSALEILSGQKIRRIWRKLVVWKEDSLARSWSVILQHSDP